MTLAQHDDRCFLRAIKSATGADDVDLTEGAGIMGAVVAHLSRESSTLATASKIDAT